MVYKAVHENLGPVLPDLHQTLDNASTVLSAMLDLERRDTLAPQLLLGAADRAIEALAQWRARIEDAVEFDQERVVTDKQPSPVSQ